MVTSVAHSLLTFCMHFCFSVAAFLDSKSGMVNLVVEYMDGGSLQDVVDNGGCQDEEALADIAYQVSSCMISCVPIPYIVAMITLLKLLF